MRCPQCGHDNGAELKFCGECGTRLALLCSECGARNSPSQKFCGECGARLATGVPVVRPPSPESYTPKHLAENEGERKQVTVLFADLKGSMELLADRDPEEARRILDPVLEHMMEAVHRFEGTVNQVMGDGIMALFGAPVAHEDHAVRACYAALRMQESVKRYAEEARRSHTAVVKIRVGLNSGEVVVRAIGSDLHMDYTAVGQTTHLSARMEQLADPGTVLVTSATLALVEDFVEVKPLGPMRVKGLTEAIEAYELAGANPVRSRFHAHAARGLTTFVGRTREIAQLEEALDLAQQGRGQVVAIVGEPGMGKSRLVWEFVQSHRMDGCLVLECASTSYGKATPYLPVIELLRAYFQIDARDEVRKIREKVTGKVLSLDRAMERALPALLALLEVAVEDEPWTRLEPSRRRLRILDAATHLLLREGQVQPLVVVFEDLHWIDGETQAVLDGLVETLPTARMLLLATYRPEYQHQWGGKTYYSQHRIDALRPGNSEELLGALLGPDLALAALKRLLIAQTEGNPFFLEETVRTLIETKVLTGEPGAYRLVQPLEGLKIPATVQAILAARIDRLDPDDKRLLHAASVIGKDVPLALLAAISDVTEDELRRGLARLQAAEFLYEAGLFPDLAYTFKHALTHEITYASLLHDRRRALHARIVEAIESEFGDRLAEHTDRLAHHALRGELWDKALRYLSQAGRQARSRSAHREAAACLQQALGVLTHLPESRSTLEQGIDIRLDLEQSLYPLGDLARALQTLREAEGLAVVAQDPQRLARVLARLTYELGAVGDLAQAVQVGQQAVRAADASGDRRIQEAANVTLGRAYYAVGDYRHSMECSRRNIAAVTDPLGGPGDYTYSRTFLVLCLAEVGEFAEGIACGEAAVRAAGVHQRPEELVWAYLGLGRLHLIRGDFDKTIAVLQRALPLVETGEVPVYFSRIASSLGSAYALSGQLAAALPLLAQAVAQAVSINFMYAHSLVVAHLSEGHLLTGRADAASRLALDALRLAREQQERGNEAWVVKLLGEIAVRQDIPDFDAAEQYYRRSKAAATALEMRPLVAHCHLGLGQLYRRTGKRQEGGEHLTTATTMYRDMGMTYWLEKAAAKMKELPRGI